MIESEPQVQPMDHGGHNKNKKAERRGDPMRRG
jgi:hypothetical protein